MCVCVWRGLVVNELGCLEPQLTHVPNELLHLVGGESGVVRLAREAVHKLLQVSLVQGAVVVKVCRQTTNQPTPRRCEHSPRNRTDLLQMDLPVPLPLILSRAVPIPVREIPQILPKIYNIV